MAPNDSQDADVAGRPTTVKEKFIAGSILGFAFIVYCVVLFRGVVEMFFSLDKLD